MKESHTLANSTAKTDEAENREQAPKSCLLPGYTVVKPDLIQCKVSISKLRL